MADRTLTVNGQPFTFNRDRFAGVRTMTVNGETVTVDRTAQVIDSDRKGESRPLLSKVVGGAAAAYSLRDLNDKAGNNKVVRVRRASDNHERDFLAKEVSNGTLQNWVNTQVVAPLDLKTLEIDGRTSEFLIAKAAYSLRSLGTRQATLAATGDTVARADGKFVVQVRRSSDDALKSFTADEVTDGTLLAFVGTGGSDNGFVQTWYDQSVTTEAGDTATGNHAIQTTPSEQPLIVSAGALVADNGIAFDGSTSKRTLVAPSVSGLETKLSVFSASIRLSSGHPVSLSSSSNSSKYFAIQENGLSSKLNTRNSTNVAALSATSGAERLTFALTTGETVTSAGSRGSALTTTTTDYGNDYDSDDLNQILIGSLRTVSPANAHYYNGRIQEIIIYAGATLGDQTDNRTAIEANIGEAHSIDLPSGVDSGENQVDGFVETWYDQSGNGRDATQFTAGSQPKIVDGGSLVVDAGNAAMQFDATNDFLTADSLASNFSGTDKASSAFIKYGGMADTGTFNQFYSFSNSSAIGGIDAGDLIMSLFRSNAPSGSRYLGYLIDDDSSAMVELTSTSSLGANKLVTLVGDRSSDSMFSNGSATTISDLDSTSGALTFDQFSIGVARRGTTLSNYFSGKMSEFIIYQSDQSANRPAIEANINNQYDIY